ncbi:hypothetical protein [Caulobacter sp.]|uniref:hypothetical protein n=1 Tax=Caulobacter sp. TaxID=78 RepID=UPI0031D07B31
MPSPVQSTIGKGNSLRGPLATIIPGGISTFMAIASTANVRQTWRAKRSGMESRLVTRLAYLKRRALSCVSLNLRGLTARPGAA